MAARTVNAVIHRDYAIRGTQVLLEVFDAASWSATAAVWLTMRNAMRRLNGTELDLVTTRATGSFG